MPRVRAVSSSPLPSRYPAAPAFWREKATPVGGGTLPRFLFASRGASTTCRRNPSAAPRNRSLRHSEERCPYRFHDIRPATLPTTVWTAPKCREIPCLRAGDTRELRQIGYVPTLRARQKCIMGMLSAVAREGRLSWRLRSRCVSGCIGTARGRALTQS